jgi:alkylhydroperoxidase family enzyme
MARIAIPAGEGLEAHRMWDIDPGLGHPAWALRQAIFNDNKLDQRVHEAVRYAVSLSTQCPVCLRYRPADAGEQGIDGSFYDAIPDYAASPVLSERERVAVEFTDLFCRDHLAISDELFERLKRNFTEVELFDLLVTVARHLGFSRLSQVLQLDVACGPDPPAATG